MASRAETDACADDAAYLRGGIARGVVGVGLVVMLASVASLGTLPVLAAGLVAAGVLALIVRPGLLFALGLGATVFSGYSDQLGLPIGADRLLIAAGLGGLVLGLPLGHAPRPRIRFGIVHLALAAAATAGVVSAARAGVITDQDAVFGLLDRLGLVPFLFFVLAPVLFPGPRERNYLLVVLVGVGWYLGLVALLEGLGLESWVWPSYIADPGVGIHFERARGPFAEAVANGLSMVMCLAAAAVAASVWRAAVARRLALALVPVLGLGILFTVTRAVWLAALLAAVVLWVVHPQLRRRAPVLLIMVSLLIVSAVLFVPGFSELASQRSVEQRPLWDRLNTNAAAIEAVLDQPVGGIGWQQFRDDGQRYLWQSDDYPLTGEGIEVHNVFLSHVAELGLVGGSAWFAAFVLGVVWPCVSRPLPELRMWRYGLVAVAVAWLAVASFGPLSYAFPNLLLWTWAGIVSSPRTTVPPEPSA